MDVHIDKARRGNQTGCVNHTLRFRSDFPDSFNFSSFHQDIGRTVNPLRRVDYTGVFQ